MTTYLCGLGTMRSDCNPYDKQYCDHDTNADTRYTIAMLATRNAHACGRLTILLSHMSPWH